MSTPTVDGTFGLTEWAGYYADGDGVIGPGVGGQAYDVEYLGLYIESGTVYFGLQTGFDLVSGRDWYGTHFEPGDFALDIDDDGAYDYGIDFSFPGGPVVDFTLYSNPTWESVYYSQHTSEADPWQGSGALVASFSGAYGTPSDSYVLEGSFDLALLGLYFDGPITIHWTMECGNDYLDQTSSPVPEPSTMLLFGTGFLGLAMIGRKKLFKK